VILNTIMVETEVILVHQEVAEMKGQMDEVSAKSCRHLLPCTEQDTNCVWSHVEWRKRMIPFGCSSENTARFINTFISAFPNATVTGCYFHLTQSVMRNVNEIGMKEDYENNDRLRQTLRCLPALAVVPSSDVAEAFFKLADTMPRHKKMPEILAYLNIRIFKADDGQDAGKIMVLLSFLWKDGIISKLRLKGLQEQRTLSKVGIMDYRHFFSVITQRYGLLWKDFKKIWRCK